MKTFNIELLKELENLPQVPIYWCPDSELTFPISMLHYHNKFKQNAKVSYNFSGKVHTDSTKSYLVDFSPVQLLESIARAIIAGLAEYNEEQRAYYSEAGKNSEELLTDLSQ